MITLQITQFLQHLGWTIKLEKSNLIPSNQFKYLGWIWNSIDILDCLSEKYQSNIF
jgi:hypothetical protein